MAKQDNHWFPFYYEKFLVGIVGMNEKEVGAYVLLLIRQFDKGGIPETEPFFKKFPRVLEKFKKKPDGLYYNERMLEVCLEQTEIRVKRSKRAKEGAKARWENMLQASDKHSVSNAKAMPDTVKESKVHIHMLEASDKPNSKTFRESLFKTLSSLEIWVENVCMSQRWSDVKQFRFQLDKFLRDKIATEEIKPETSIADIKRFFVNWCKYNPIDEPEEETEAPKVYKGNFFER